MVRKAEELVILGEKAFVVFTRGDHLTYDEMGEGQTGNWIAGAQSLSKIDKVIIYLRNEQAGTNLVFMGNYSYWVESPEQHRKVIHFTRFEKKGFTNSNWLEFGGNSWSPTFYIR